MQRQAAQPGCQLLFATQALTVTTGSGVDMISMAYLYEYLYGSKARSRSSGRRGQAPPAKGLAPSLIQKRFLLAAAPILMGRMRARPQLEVTQIEVCRFLLQCSTPATACWAEAGGQTANSTANPAYSTPANMRISGLGRILMTRLSAVEQIQLGSTMVTT